MTFWIDVPTAAELQCLANIKEWVRGLEFEAEWGGVENPFRLRRPRRPAWWAEATSAVRKAYLTGR